jgi:hypothetical protein
VPHRERSVITFRQSTLSSASPHKSQRTQFVPAFSKPQTVSSAPGRTSKRTLSRLASYFFGFTSLSPKEHTYSSFLDHIFFGLSSHLRENPGGRARAEPDGTCAETRFRLSPKRMSLFKSAGESVQSTAGSRGVRISVSNAGYTTFRGRVIVLATHSIRQFPLHFPSRASPCATTFRTHYTFISSAVSSASVRTSHNVCVIPAGYISTSKSAW